MNFKVKFLNQAYDVRFFRQLKVNGAGKMNSAVTTCTISSIDESKTGREKYTLVSQGVAKCNLVMDKYNKVAGQKVALTRALQSDSFAQDKKLRMAFWAKFLSAEATKTPVLA